MHFKDFSNLALTAQLYIILELQCMQEASEEKSLPPEEGKQASFYQETGWLDLLQKVQKEVQQACRHAHNDYINNTVSEPGVNNKKLFA